MLCRYCTYHQLILRRLSELERTDTQQTHTHDYCIDSKVYDYCMPRGSAHRGTERRVHALSWHITQDQVLYLQKKVTQD